MLINKQPSSQQPTSAAAAFSWDKRPKGDRMLQIRISRNTLIAIVISLLIHAILLFTVIIHPLDSGPEAEPAESSQIVMQLGPKAAPKAAETPQPSTQAEPEPAPAPKAPPKAVSKPVSKPSKPTSPPVMAAQPPARDQAPTPLDRRVPPQPAPEPDMSPPPTDMMSYVKQQQDRRRAQGDPSILNEDAAAKDRGPTADEIREANIQRNLKEAGGGVFQITQMSSRGAKFVFRGWRYFSNPRTEYIEVEAPPDGDIRRAVVKRMIEIIRRDYKGDFTWESKRLGRVVTLSARPQDNDGLEDFLIKDFQW
ncbi:hypothetical protein [Methylovorus glucosotrophus]|nr:hypothetical protein [Methylovorus glucosotrophus]